MQFPPVLSLGDSVFQCNQELRIASIGVRDDRKKLLDAKSLPQRIAFYVCDTVSKGGIWVTIGCLAVGSLFSAKFLIVGAVALVAFVVGNVARAYFETITPYEENLVKAFAQPSLLGIKEANDNLPNAKALKEKREAVLQPLVSVSGLDFEKIAKDQKNKFDTFLNFFGSQELVEHLKTKKSLTPKLENENKKVGEKLQKCHFIYASSLMLEAIQHIANKNLALASKNAQMVCDMQGKFVPISLYMFELNSIAKAMKAPSKQFQEKVQKFFENQGKQRTYKLSDLDTVFAMALLN